MKNSKCKNCGAEISILDSICKFCKTKNIPDRKLSKEDQEKLKKVALSMEESLSSAEGNNIFQGIMFLIFGILTIISYFFFSMWLESEIKNIIFTIFFGLILFLVFGAILIEMDKKSVKKKYENDIKLRINEYLETMNFHRYEFDFIAEEYLPQKAKLRKFLYM